MSNRRENTHNILLKVLGKWFIERTAFGWLQFPHCPHFHFWYSLLYPESLSNCQQWNRLRGIYKSSSRAMTAVTVAIIRISALTFPIQMNQRRLAPSMFGEKVIHHMRKQPTTPADRKILPTTKSFWYRVILPKWISSVTIRSSHRNWKLSSHYRPLACNWDRSICTKWFTIASYQISCCGCRAHQPNPHRSILVLQQIHCSTSIWRNPFRYHFQWPKAI